MIGREDSWQEISLSLPLTNAKVQKRHSTELMTMILGDINVQVLKVHPQHRLSCKTSNTLKQTTSAKTLSEDQKIEGKPQSQS